MTGQAHVIADNVVFWLLTLAFAGCLAIVLPLAGGHAWRGERPAGR